MTLRSARVRLDEALFLDAPPTRGTLSRGEYSVVVLAALILGTILQLLRPGLGVSLDSLWAEDGPIFLQTAMTVGLLDALFEPYSGYLVVIPRLIGEVAGAVPIEEAAATVSILSAALAALSGLVVWFAAAAHIRSPYLRGALAVLTVLVPVAGLESVDSAAYVSWYMLFGTFWLLLWRPRTPAAAAAGGAFILLTALSNPGIWFLLPVAALRALAIRDRRDIAIVAPYAVGAATQLPVMALNPGQDSAAIWSGEILTAYAQRVVDAGMLGQRIGGEAWAQLGWPFLILSVAVLIAMLGWGLWRAGQTERWIAALAIPISLTLFIASIYQRGIGDQVVWPEGFHHGAAGRYAIVPALLLVSVAIVLIDARPRRRDSRRGPPLAAAIVGLLAIAAVSSFDVRDKAVRGSPAWRESISAAERVCEQGNPSAAVPVSPPGFGIELPCDKIGPFPPPKQPRSDTQ